MKAIYLILVASHLFGAGAMSKIEQRESSLTIKNTRITSTTATRNVNVQSGARLDVGSIGGTQDLVIQDSTIEMHNVIENVNIEKGMHIKIGGME